jgi:Flp pilus assembly protein CpaB
MQFAQRLLSTRGGTIAVSAMAAVLAAAILVTYLHRYRASVNASGVPVTVLVANGLIEKGMSGEVVAGQNLYRTTTISKGEVVQGAITDPDALKGQVATADVFPGEQLTTGKFSTTGATSLANKITAGQRILTLPFDSAHGMIGQVEPGDHIDVYAGFNVRRLGPDGRPEPGVTERPVLKLLSSDVQVIDVPKSGSGGIGGSKAKLTVKASDEIAAKMAFTVDNGILWAVLRPSANAAPTNPDIISVETVLFGIPSVQVVRSLGAKP